MPKGGAGAADADDDESAADAEVPEEAAEETGRTGAAAFAEDGAVDHEIGIVISVPGKAKEEEDQGDDAEDEAKSEEEQSGVD